MFHLSEAKKIQRHICPNKSFYSKSPILIFKYQDIYLNLFVFFMQDISLFFHISYRSCASHSIRFVIYRSNVT